MTEQSEKKKRRKLDSFPEGTRYNNWSLFTETQKGVKRFVIRRKAFLPDGTTTNQRLHVKEYGAYRENHDELQKLVIRLNHQIPEAERTKQKLILRHAYIDEGLLADYQAHLEINVPNQQNVRKEFSYLLRYFLHFYIHRLDLPSPLQWHLEQTKWAKALLNNFSETEDDSYRIWKKDRVVSEKTIQEIVMGANRFMQWLHQRRPVDVKPLKFKPVSRAAFKKLTALRERLGLAEEGTNIPDEHWNEILKNCPSELEPFAKLGYFYGLRRSECLGVRPGDVKNGHLGVSRQLSGISKVPEGQRDGSPIGKPRYDDLKGRKSRKTPHWFASNKEAYRWIADIFSQKLLVHPDTLSERWTEFMESLNYSYGFHDLRHTFITKAMRKFPPADVMLACGHENIETCMGYLHDDRQLDDQEFIPEEAA